MADQSDDIKGIIMIPDQGKLSFYLSTMVTDLCVDILHGLSQLALSIEKRPLIHGPAPLEKQTSNSAFGKLSVSSPLSAVNSSIQAPAPSALSATVPASFLSRDASVNMDTPTMASPNPTSFQLFNSDKTQKRTPARILKLLGDVFAMAGKLESAISQ